MRSRCRLLVSLFLAFAAGMAVGPPGEAWAGSDEPHATGAVQVTANPNPTRAHTSPQIDRHPETGELVIVEGELRDSQQCNIHISTDDGRSWSPGGDLMPEEHTDCTLTADYGPYATLEFADDGTLYVAFVASTYDPDQGRREPAPGVQRHVYLSRSTDAGRTFEHTMVYEATERGAEWDMNKGPMLAADPTDPDRVYVGWRQGEHQSEEMRVRPVIAASDDGGRTFGEPVDVGDERGGDYPAIDVDSDGAVHAVYWDRAFGAEEGDPAPIKYVRSADFGKTYTDPREIDPGNQRAARPPLLKADPGSEALYMVWFANQEVMNEAEDFEDARHDILFRASRDGGGSWSDRVVLSPDEDANQFDPGIAVAPNGRVDVAWYDFRDSPTPPADVSGHGGEDGFAHVYFTSSEDQGRSFAPVHRVTDRMIDRSVGVWSNNVDSKHNIGMASTDAAVYLAWQDTRNADSELQNEDVYSAAVLVGEPDEDVERAGAMVPRLQGLGFALFIGGVVLIVASKTSRRRVGLR